jgi:hypothetical protein
MKFAITAFLFLLVGGMSPAPVSAAEEDVSSAIVGVGYREVDFREFPGPAAKYMMLDSGPTLHGEIIHFQDHRAFHLVGDYLGHADFDVEAHFDYRGLIRVDAFGEGVQHNLLRIPYADRPDALSDISSVTFGDANPEDDYFLRVKQFGTRVRTKAPGIPAHLNLSYWRLERSGRTQLRYLQEGTQNCTTCHMESRTRDVDRVTEEFKAGIDAHVGFVDIALEGVVRDFRSKEPIPTDFFGGHAFRTDGFYQHDVHPESRLVQGTLQVNTALSGGLTGAASATAGKRENRSQVTDVRPIESETRFWKVASDVTYTPGERWLVAFRYRLLDLDNTNTDHISADGLIRSYPPFVPVTPRPAVQVRDNVDITRAFYQASITYRPVRAFSLRGDFRREDIKRGNTGGPVKFDALDFTDPLATIHIDPVWELPENEIIDRWRLSLSARPWNSRNSRITAWYQYTTTDDPAYGISAATGHEAFASYLWTPSAYWGGNVTLRGKKEENDEHRLFLKSTTAPGEFAGFDLTRSVERGDATVGVWMTPLDVLTLGFHYGFFRTKVEQDVVFGMYDTAIVSEDANYRQRVHTANATAAWRILTSLTARGEVRWTDSSARFSPDFIARPFTFATGELIVSPDGLEEISRLDIRQMGYGVGLEWEAGAGVRIAARYSYDEYEDRKADFDRSVETYLLQLAKSW